MTLVQVRPSLSHPIPCLSLLSTLVHCNFPTFLETKNKKRHLSVLLLLAWGGSGVPWKLTAPRWRKNVFNNETLDLFFWEFKGLDLGLRLMAETDRHGHTA